jgi:hypothetical protein
VHRAQAEKVTAFCIEKVLERPHQLVLRVPCDLGRSTGPRAVDAYWAYLFASCGIHLALWLSVGADVLYRRFGANEGHVDALGGAGRLIKVASERQQLVVMQPLLE